MQHQRLMVPMQASRIFVNSMKPFGTFPISHDIGKLALIRLLLLQLLPTMEEDNKTKQNKAKHTGKGTENMDLKLQEEGRK